MSLDYWDKNTIEAAIRNQATTPLKKKIESLQEAFDAQKIKKPEVLAQTPADGKFHKYGENTAVKVKKISPDMEILFQFDFDNGLAMIMTFQQNRLAVTETKKMSEMPSKMVTAAQQVVSGTMPGKQPTHIRRRGQ